MEEHNGVTDETLGIVEKSKEIFKKIDAEFETIIGCNQKTAYMQGDIQIDISDILGEFKNYIEDLLLSFRCPLFFEDH